MSEDSAVRATRAIVDRRSPKATRETQGEERFLDVHPVRRREATLRRQACIIKPDYAVSPSETLETRERRGGAVVKQEHARRAWPTPSASTTRAIQPNETNMTRSVRLFAVLLLIETSLAALWFWLVAGIRSGDLQTAVPAGQAIGTISASIGGTMGLFAALAFALWTLTRRRQIAR
jgi:hypothetical protein